MDRALCMDMHKGEWAPWVLVVLNCDGNIHNSHKSSPKKPKATIRGVPREHMHIPFDKKLMCVGCTSEVPKEWGLEDNPLCCPSTNSTMQIVSQYLEFFLNRDGGIHNNHCFGAYIVKC